MNTVAISRITPIGMAVVELLYVMLANESVPRGSTEVTQHLERGMRITRLKMRLDKHPGGRHFGYCNVWGCERGSLDFTVYLTDFEETIELFRHHQRFEEGLLSLAGHEYNLSDVYQACKDIKAFLLDGELPSRLEHCQPCEMSLQAA